MDALDPCGNPHKHILNKDDCPEMPQLDRRCQNNTEEVALTKDVCLQNAGLEEETHNDMDEDATCVGRSLP